MTTIIFGDNLATHKRNEAEPKIIKNRFATQLKLSDFNQKLELELKYDFSPRVKKNQAIYMLRMKQHF